MKKAKYKLDFHSPFYFDIETDMSVGLSDSSNITFHRSKGMNYCTIVFEIDSLDERNARDEGKKRVEEYLGCMLLTTDASVGDVTYPSKPQLLNPEDFQGMPKTGYFDVRIHTGVTSRLGQQTLDTAATLVARMRALPIEDMKTIHRTLRWLRKASTAHGEDRFIYDWISFDSMLGLLKKSKATQNLIPEFLDRALNTQAANRIVQKHHTTIETLSKANLVGFRGTGYSEKLALDLKKKVSPRAILPKVVLCIYEVRNNMFHKGESTELTTHSDKLLMDIAKECLKSYLSS